MAAAPQQTLDFPSLVDHLKRDGFHLVPNHARPLDGRVVDSRFDPETGRMRPVTDYEFLARVEGQPEWHVRRWRQVWQFDENGVTLRVNDSFKTWTNHGLQYATACAACASTVWTNADEPALPLCRQCRSRSGWCRITNRTCTTAYKRHGCRCDACRTWKSAKARRLRARRQELDPILSPTADTERRDSGGPTCSGEVLESKNGVQRPAALWPPMDGWDAAWWLPESVQDSMTRYEETVNAFLGDA